MWCTAGAASRTPTAPSSPQAPSTVPRPGGSRPLLCRFSSPVEICDLQFDSAYKKCDRQFLLDIDSEFDECYYLLIQTLGRRGGRRQSRITTPPIRGFRIPTLVTYVILFSDPASFINCVFFLTPDPPQSPPQGLVPLAPVWIWAVVIPNPPSGLTRARFGVPHPLPLIRKVFPPSRMGPACSDVRRHVGGPGPLPQDLLPPRPDEPAQRPPSSLHLEIAIQMLKFSKHINVHLFINFIASMFGKTTLSGTTTPYPSTVGSRTTESSMGLI